MSELNDPSAREGDAEQRELDEARYDEEALRARRRQYGLAALAIVATAGAVVAIPWRDHLEAGGRIAPQRWARVHSEAPGVVREVAHTSGDTVEAGEVIAVLDFDEQRDALETARLALSRERQKLADLELRVRENSIQREGADAIAKLAGARAVAADRIDGSRIATLDPVADAVLEGVRGFTTSVRAELVMNRSARMEVEFKGEDLSHRVRGAMDRYSARAAEVADHLTKVGGPEAGRQFRFELEDLRFAYALADHSMEEILVKHDLVARGLLATEVLRELSSDLERETMELAHSFRALSGSARSLLGSRAEQSERMRGAEESRRLLANEFERLEAQRTTIQSGIAAAELTVRSAERHQGKTAIRAPIRGTLAGDSLSRFDSVSANTSVGLVEDATGLVLKVRVDDGDLRRIKIGQAVGARARDGREVQGSVVWTTPLVGQEVKDQSWNVLIQLDRGTTGIELGEKVLASIDVGRRSLLGRWLAPAEPAESGPRVAFVNDPTELREAPEPGAPARERLASGASGLRNGPDGS